jgi:hypothetical protein
MPDFVAALSAARKAALNTSGFQGIPQPVGIMAAVAE